MNEPMARRAVRGSGGTFLKGYGDPGFVSEGASQNAFLWEQSVRANASVARINMPWSSVAPVEPASPRDPSDPAYRWAGFDQTIAQAAAQGHQVLLTLYLAPSWAEGPSRPDPEDGWPVGTWKPDPRDFGEFVEAVATRYSGVFPVAGPAALTRVQYITVWNEPNLSEYLTPQSVKRGGKYRLTAPDHYRKLVNSASAGVERSLNPDAQVVAGATSPYGDPVGGRRTRPLQFLRDFLCLKDDLSRQRKCSGGEADFDIVAHHPITLSGGPHRSAIHPDDVAMPDFKNIVKTVRVAEKRNTVIGNRHPAWATEFWWETDPPDRVYGVPVSKHARWVQESLYMLFRQGASGAIWLQILDDRVQDDGFSGLQGGHFFSNHDEKPSFTAFRFPFHADRKSTGKVKVWAIPPASGQVEIERESNGGWMQVKTFAGTDGVPKQTTVKLKGDQRLRANLGGEATIPVRVKKKR